MSNPSATNPPKSGLSLYANLLDPTTSTTPGSVIREPVVFKPAGAASASEDQASAKKSQIDAATLRFQPTKRPQLAQKPKPKSSFPKAIPQNASEPTATNAPLANATRPAVKSTLADWTADGDDVNDFYQGEKRQRGGRKRRKKNKEDYAVAQDWDDIYDPSRPNSYEEYKNSDEKIREVREWKDRLYAHRMARKSTEKDSDEEESYRPRMSNQFAPPLSFAPPPIDNSSRKSSPGPGASVNDQSLSLPPPTSNIAAEPHLDSSISRAPVRYNLPSAPSELPASEAELEKALADEPEEDSVEDGKEVTRSLRPGQKGFAERLMSKYGWSKGSGLGAEGTGIVNALSVKVDKRKKKSDAEGGGFREPAKGKIVGGQKSAAGKASEQGKFGAMSEVIKLRGMVDGMDLDQEVEGSGDGGLMQEIGEECGEKYGLVERVYIHRQDASPAIVFVKFTSQLSALRAVNALEGRIFNGNTISAQFFDTEKFEQGNYE